MQVTEVLAPGPLKTEDHDIVKFDCPFMDDPNELFAEENFAENTDEDVEELTDDTGSLIRPNLYLGSMDAESNKAWLEKANITHVLQVAVGLEKSDPEGRKYMVVEAHDGPEEDLVCRFKEMFAFIDEARGQGTGVLVHCVAGVSRSAAVVVGYLMSREGLTLRDAMRSVSDLRPWVNPNPGFILQLEEYERRGCDPSKWRSWHIHMADRIAENRAALLSNPAAAAAAVLIQEGLSFADVRRRGTR